MKRTRRPPQIVIYSINNKLSPTELNESHRSWMIGLAGHGLEAVRSIPNLYEDYLSDVGVQLTEGAIYIGSKKMSMGSQNKNMDL